MKNLILVTLAALALLSAPARAGDGSFDDSALGRELIALGMKFLDDPGDFFFNLHTNNEDYSPVPAGRHGAVRFNFLPTALPVTWGNLTAKATLLNERARTPQIDIAGTYGDLLALRAVAGDVEPTFTDYSAGLIAAKSVDPKTRLFGGIKYSALVMDVAFSTPVVQGDFQMDGMHFTIADTVLFSGITHQVTTERALVAQVGYGFKYRKIVARVMTSRRHLDIGMDIFPEGLFVFHPFVAWHWYF